MSIWTALNFLTLYVVNFFMGALPDTPTGVSNVISNMTSGIIYIYNTIAWIIPVETLALALGVILLVEYTNLGYQLFARIIRVLSLGFVDFT